MNQTTRKIILVGVIVLVVLFGVGQFFASSTLITSEQQQTQNQQTPPTQVITYTPPAPSTSTPVESGSCWTNSIAAAYRTDAWRCTVGNAINDPCFQIASSTNLLCGVNPANPSSTDAFVLKLTKPLPAVGTFPNGVPSNWAWLVQLADGTLCSPFTGTLPPVTLGGQTAGYGCAPGPLGKELVIFGDLNNSSTQWTALVGDLAESNATSGPPVYVDVSSTIPVSTVWQ